MVVVVVVVAVVAIVTAHAPLSGVLVLVGQVGSLVVVVVVVVVVKLEMGVKINVPRNRFGDLGSGFGVMKRDLGHRHWNRRRCRRH